MKMNFCTEDAVPTEISLHKPPNSTLLCCMLYNEYFLVLWNCHHLGAYLGYFVIQKSLDESLTSQRPLSCHPKYRST